MSNIFIWIIFYSVAISGVETSCRFRDLISLFEHEQNSNCYYFINDLNNWYRADTNCLRNGGHLATTGLEQLIEIANKNEDSTTGRYIYWVGLYQVAGEEFALVNDTETICGDEERCGGYLVDQCVKRRCCWNDAKHECYLPNIGPGYSTLSGVHPEHSSERQCAAIAKSTTGLYNIESYSCNSTWRYICQFEADAHDVSSTTIVPRNSSMSPSSPTISGFSYTEVSPSPRTTDNDIQLTSCREVVPGTMKYKAIRELCFNFVPGPVNWFQADDICQQYGGDLAFDETTLLKTAASNVNAHVNFWIGLYQKAGQIFAAADSAVTDCVAESQVLENCNLILGNNSQPYHQEQCMRHRCCWRHNSCFYSNHKDLVEITKSNGEWMFGKPDNLGDSNNRQCVVMHHDDHYRWDDQSCLYEKNGYVCQFKLGMPLSTTPEIHTQSGIPVVLVTIGTGSGNSGKPLSASSIGGIAVACIGGLVAIVSAVVLIYKFWFKRRRKLSMAPPPTSFSLENNRQKSEDYIYPQLTISGDYSTDKKHRSSVDHRVQTLSCPEYEPYDNVAFIHSADDITSEEYYGSAYGERTEYGSPSSNSDVDQGRYSI